MEGGAQASLSRTPLLALRPGFWPRAPAHPHPHPGCVSSPQKPPPLTQGAQHSVGTQRPPAVLTTWWAPHLMEGSSQEPCGHGTPALGSQSNTGKMTSEAPASSQALGALLSDFLIIS